VQLAIALSEEKEDHILAATAWALGQIGRHTPEHAKAVAVANVLPRLLQLYLKTGSSEDLQAKVLTRPSFVYNHYIRLLIEFRWFFTGKTIVKKHPSKVHASTGAGASTA
jgi:hypothetical protein